MPQGVRRNTRIRLIDKEWPKLEASFEAWLDPNNFDENGQQRASLTSFQS